jgi:hypothetical protein
LQDDRTASGRRLAFVELADRFGRRSLHTQEKQNAGGVKPPLQREKRPSEGGRYIRVRRTRDLSLGVF